MKITAENIEELKVGDSVWSAEGFRMPERYIYTGIHKFVGEARTFISAMGGGFIIYISGNSEIDKVAERNLYTTYDAACERMRIECINLIDHYNKHQLKNNPIPIIPEDEQYLWKNME